MITSNTSLPGLGETDNPVVQRVIDTFYTTYTMVGSFIDNKESAIKGLLISGDAGTGKTHWVRKAFADRNAQPDAEYIKGGSISAAALYVKLYQNRNKGRVLILDDCDLIHRSGSEKRDILDMIKGATEPSSRPRQISWERATRNPLMIALDVPMSFEFDGTIIWITNDTIVDIKKAAKQHYEALISRFNIVKCYFNDDEKLLYTLHLIKEVDMLGDNCEAFDGGYPEEVQKDALAYIRKNVKTLTEITPRVAIKLADLRHHFPDTWETLADNQIGNWKD
jgi:hypothetical protein